MIQILTLAATIVSGLADPQPTEHHVYLGTLVILETDSTFSRCQRACTHTTGCTHLSFAKNTLECSLFSSVSELKPQDDGIAQERPNDRFVVENERIAGEALSCHIRTENDCKWTCAQSEACEFWSWDSDGTICRLFESIESVEPVDSGSSYGNKPFTTAPVIEENVRYENWFGSTQAGSPEACAQSCHDLSNCIMWVNKKNGCWHYDDNIGERDWALGSEHSAGDRPLDETEWNEDWVIAPGCPSPPPPPTDPITTTTDSATSLTTTTDSATSLTTTTDSATSLTTTTTPAENNGMSTGAIVGSAIAGLAILGAAIAGGVIYMQKRKTANDDIDGTSEPVKDQDML